MKLISTTVLILIIVIITICNIKNVESKIPHSKVKIAMFLSGDFKDLGYNYMFNDARIHAESILQTNFSLFYKDLDLSKRQTELSFDDAIGKGANLFIVCSNGQTDIALKYAEQYKSEPIYWIIKTAKRPDGIDLPKVAVLDFNTDIPMYALGYFSGLQSKTGVVGFVSPSNGYASNANAFYLGAKGSRPNIKFVNAYTGSWFNPEVAYKAAQLLIENGADFIGMSQDDMSVQKAVMDSGSLGLGVTGYPNRIVYGADIGLSYITNWTAVITRYAEHVINDTWPLYDNYSTSLSEGGSIAFDQYSFKVDLSVQLKVNAEIDKLKNENYLPFRCSPMYGEYYQLNVNGCIDYPTFNKNRFILKGDDISKVIDFGTYSIPIEFVDYPMSMILGISIVSGICILLCIVSMILVVIFRHAKIIRSASPAFCLLILFGCIIIFCGCIIFAQSPTDASCSTRVWLLSIGFTIFLGSLLVKNWRIWLLFDNPQLKKRALTNWKLYPWVMGILAVDVLILSLWHGLGDIHSEARIGIDSLSKYEYRNVCSSGEQGSTALYILIVFHGLMLIIACFISFKIKVVDIDEFNESKPISTSVYIITFCLFIVIPLMVSPLTVQSQTTIICVCAIVTTIVSIGLLFGSKFYKMATIGIELNQSFATSTKSSSFSHSLGGGNNQQPGNAFKTGTGIHEEESDESEEKGKKPVKSHSFTINENMNTQQSVLAHFTSDTENTSANHQTEGQSKQVSHMAHFSSDTDEESMVIGEGGNGDASNSHLQVEPNDMSVIQSRRLSNQSNGEYEINQNNL